MTERQHIVWWRGRRTVRIIPVRTAFIIAVIYCAVVWVAGYLLGYSNGVRDTIQTVTIRGERK